jgi:hypothetical protein
MAVALAGCGTTTYFAGRVLPPSGLTNRVLIAIQNPSAISHGLLQIVDAYYDIRYKYNNQNAEFSISGYSGNLPATIQNMPEEQIGGVYATGDGSYTLINYAKEVSNGVVKGLSGLSSSIYITRNQLYLFAANQSAHTLTVLNPGTSSGIVFGLPGVYRVSVNPGGSAAVAFVQNSNYVYYLRQLTASQTIAYSGGSSTWPRAALDCEPQNAPLWCLFQAQSPDNVDSTGNAYGAPLVFDRPVKALFSGDGGTAYVLNCGPECGGNDASVSQLPVGPMIYLSGQQSGTLPTQNALNSATIQIEGGASNALIAGSTMYVVGQQLLPDGLFTGNLTVVNLSNNTAGAATSISDGTAGGPSRLMLADDNTLWIGMTKCNNGERFAKGMPYGCLTMYNTSTNTVTMLESYLGDATGIADVEGLHKVYVVEGGQVYIFKTTDGSSINNQYVAVTGTAGDVAYMDAKSDGNNTVY